MKNCTRSQEFNGTGQRLGRNCRSHNIRFDLDAPLDRSLCARHQRPGGNGPQLRSQSWRIPVHRSGNADGAETRPGFG